MVGGHHYVVTAAAGEQLAFQGFVGIEDIVDGLDPRLPLELFQRRFADVIRPVVDMYGGSLGGCRSGYRGGDDQRLEGRAHGMSPLVTGRACPGGKGRPIYWKNLWKSTDLVQLPLQFQGRWRRGQMTWLQRLQAFRVLVLVFQARIAPAPGSGACTGRHRPAGACSRLSDPT